MENVMKKPLTSQRTDIDMRMNLDTTPHVLELLASFNDEA
jgi:hypothetical protein